MSAALDHLVGFGRALRARGLPVGTGRILTFCRAVATLEPSTRTDLYWAARATLVSRRDDVEIFDPVFAAYFGASAVEDLVTALAGGGRGRRPAEAAAAAVDEQVAGPWGLAEGEIVEGAGAVRVVASGTEILRTKSFDKLSDDERARATAMIHRLALDLPSRRSRRLRPAPKGRRFDLRRTLRSSLRTQGEPLRVARRDSSFKDRPLVLVLDVSGSMAPYARALMQFGFAAIKAARKVEVFCFGTRLTRVTGALAARSADDALERVAKTVLDWEGGTRIGDSMKELLDRYGHAAWLRGSVVVLCSDGLERGDPVLLSRQMQRLSRLTHRVVWVNPLKGDPRYQPLARGMAAALPHVDAFLSGHNVESLESLRDVVSRR